MSGRDVVVLARDASARLRGAACKNRGATWDRAEAAMAAAGTDADVLAAAEPLLRVCRSECLVRDACLEWARIDHYTGVAGGEVLNNGERRAAARHRAKIAS